MTLATMFSVGLPNCREGKSQPPGVVDVTWLRAIAVRAEELGYDGLWLNELLQLQEVRSPGSVNSYYDPIVTMGYLSAVTERIRFTTATVILPHHHPVLLSRQIATLDVYTKGRIALGIGLGGATESFRRLRGDIRGANRGAMMDEYLQALRLQWEQPAASFSGKYVQFEGAEAYPKPVQRPVPIYMAGTAEGVSERIARFGQGWIDSHTLADTIPAVAARIAARRAELGLPAGDVRVARQFYVSLAPTAEAARDNIAASGTKPPAGVSDPEERRIIGTPADAVACMAKYVRAGVSEICPIFYSADLDGLLRQVTLFASEVIPKLRRCSDA